VGVSEKGIGAQSKDAVVKRVYGKAKIFFPTTETYYVHAIKASLLTRGRRNIA